MQRRGICVYGIADVNFPLLSTLAEPLHDRIENMTLAELLALRSEAVRVTDTNCWYGCYAIAGVVIDWVESRLKKAQLLEEQKRENTNKKEI